LGLDELFFPKLFLGGQDLMRDEPPGGREVGAELTRFREEGGVVIIRERTSSRVSDRSSGR
jgi:hypothetical protein